MPNNPFCQLLISLCTHWSIFNCQYSISSGCRLVLLRHLIDWDLPHGRLFGTIHPISVIHLQECSMWSNLEGFSSSDDQNNLLEVSDSILPYLHILFQNHRLWLFFYLGSNQIPNTDLSLCFFYIIVAYQLDQNESLLRYPSSWPYYTCRSLYKNILQSHYN